MAKKPKYAPEYVPAQLRNAQISITSNSKREIRRFDDAVPPFAMVYIPMTKAEAAIYAPKMARPCWRIFADLPK